MIYLIDFENVHEEGFSALGRLGEKDAVYCFFTRNVAKISMSALAGMRSGQLHFIEAESGKQSLDLALVSYLGYLIGTRPQELYYDIVSNDNGFLKAAEFWNKHGNGLRVRVRKTTDIKPRAEAVKPQPAAAPAVRQKAPAPAAPKAPEQTAAPAEAESASLVSQAESAVQPEEVSAAPAAQQPSRQESAKQPRQRNQRQRNQRQRQNRQPEAHPAPAAAASEQAATPASAATPVPAASPAPVEEVASAPSAPVKEEALPAAAAPETRPSPSFDDAANAALEAAGINAAAVEFIQAQAEKYRDDKNRKQLVYRAVVKKYGQKNGTQIYNSAKKLLLK